MPKVLQAYKENEFTFFVVEIALNQEQQGYMEVYTEDYLNGEYHEHISIIKQNLSFIDLPVKVDEEITSYKFFLELSALEPVTYTLGYAAERERENIKTRQAEGIASAKSRGVKFGRPLLDVPKDFIRAYELYKNGLIRNNSFLCNG